MDARITSEIRERNAFVAPDGLRFDRATRSWQPYLGSHRAARRRRIAADAFLVAWAGGLLAAMLVAFVWNGV